MNNLKRYSLTFLPVFFVIFSNLYGQKANTYQFIEPNISISFDSNFFKISNRYSNESYGRESYDFLHIADPSKKIRIHLSADQPVKYPPKKIIDSIIMSWVDGMKKIQRDTFSIIHTDERIREINGFSCIGFVAHNKTSEQYSSVISGYHYSEDDETEMTCISNTKDLDTVYRTLANFLSGFKSYSSTQIETEDSLIRNKYTAIITPIKTEIEKFRYRPRTFIGLVSTKEKSEHTIAEVRLSSWGGFELFTPDENGQLIILSNDKEKGLITKKGELVLLNSFGKKVKIPFSFTYQNNGSL